MVNNLLLQWHTNSRAFEKVFKTRYGTASVVEEGLRKGFNDGGDDSKLSIVGEEISRKDGNEIVHFLGNGGIYASHELVDVDAVTNVRRNGLELRDCRNQINQTIHSRTQTLCTHFVVIT